MNRLSSTSRKPCTRGCIRRFNNFFPPSSRNFLNPRGNQFYYNYYQHEAPCYFSVPNPPVCVGRFNYCRASPSVITCSCCRHHDTAYRPKPKHNFLRPCRRGRPNPLPTPLLILWAPGSVYSNPTRLWYDLPYCSLLLREKRALRLHRHGLGHDGHRPTWLYRMSTPYVYRWNGC